MVKIKTRNIVTVMLIALLMLPVEMLMAATRSVEQARLLALRQMTKKGGDRAKGIGKAELKLVYTQNDTKAEPCYYVFATKPSETFMIRAEYVGFAILIVLMLVANLNDVLRWLGYM